jgi:hypothetical protein
MLSTPVYCIDSLMFGSTGHTVQKKVLVFYYSMVAVFEAIP